jgi:hypothetical protein
MGELLVVLTGNSQLVSELILSIRMERKEMQDASKCVRRCVRACNDQASGQMGYPVRIKICRINDVVRYLCDYFLFA